MKVPDTHIVLPPILVTQKALDVLTTKLVLLRPAQPIQLRHYLASAVDRALKELEAEGDES